MKKFLAVTLAAVMLTVNSVYAYENISVYVNGQQTTNGILVNGHTLVPLRVVAETMGCEVNWDANTKTVTISDGMRTGNSFVVRTFSMTVGSSLLTMKTYSPVYTPAYNYFDTNDVVETMDCYPIIEKGNTMVPLRVISEHFNVPIQWNGEKREVRIGNDAQNLLMK